MKPAPRDPHARSLLTVAEFVALYREDQLREGGRFVDEGKGSTEPGYRRGGDRLHDFDQPATHDMNMGNSAFVEPRGSGGEQRSDYGKGVQNIQRAKDAFKAVEGAPNQLQPLMKSTATPDGVNRALKLLESETKGEKKKIPNDVLLRMMGGNAEEQFKEFMALGTAAQTDMDAISKHMVDAVPGAKHVKYSEKDEGDLPIVGTTTGTEVLTGKPKGLDRAIRKSLPKNKGDAASVRDLVRASIVVDHIDEIPSAMATVHDAVHAQGGTLIKSDDKFAKPLKSGYRDLSVNFRTKNGAIGEIQIHLKPIMNAKERGGGHKLYDEERVLTERQLIRPLDPDESAELARLEAAEEKLYGDAFRAGGGR